MIRCNLAIIMAEQNLKITKIANDTGISRTTLTSLANNYSQGIQFETLNTLCRYLKVNPTSLISYYPVDIKVPSIHIDGNNFSLAIHFFEYAMESVDGIYGKFTEISQTLNTKNIDIQMLPCKEEDGKDNSFIKSKLSKLPRAFLTDLQNDIIELIKQELPNNYQYDIIRFSWSDKLL